MRRRLQSYGNFTTIPVKKIGNMCAIYPITMVSDSRNPASQSDSHLIREPKKSYDIGLLAGLADW